MAISYVGNTINQSTGTLSMSWPTHQSGDVAILVVETANQAASLSNAQGFQYVGGIGTAGTTSGTRMDIWWNRATSSSMSAPTIADAGDHVIATMVTWRGCIGSGVPYDEANIAFANKDTASSTTTWGPVTTNYADSWPIWIATNPYDGFSGATAWQSGTNTVLGDVTPNAVGYRGTSGNGGQILVLTATGSFGLGVSTGTTTAPMSRSERDTACQIVLLENRNRDVPVAEDDAVDVPVTNGDFEQGFEGWSVPTNPSWTITTTNPHSGTKCVRLTDGNGPSGVQKTDQVLEHWPAKPGDLWSMSGWFRNESFTGAGGLRLQARVNGSWTDMASTEAQSVGATWTQQTTAVTAVPANADAVMARIAFAGTGAINIDDLTLTRHGGPYSVDRALPVIVKATDAATGTDTATKLVAGPAPADDIGTGTDTATGQRISGAVDSGSGTEAVSRVTVGGTADQGSGLDAGQTRAQATDASSAAVDSATVRAFQAATDTGSGSETALVTRAVNDADTGTGTDTARVQLSPATEVGTGTEFVLDFARDTGTGTDTARARVLADGDSGSGSEDAIASYFANVDDDGSGTDFASGRPRASESSTGVDAGGLKADTPEVDTGSFSESAKILIRFVGDVGSGADTTRNRARATDAATAADNAVIAVWVLTSDSASSLDTALVGLPDVDLGTIVEFAQRTNSGVLDVPRLVQIDPEPRALVVEADPRTRTIDGEQRTERIDIDFPARFDSYDIPSRGRTALVKSEVRKHVAGKEY